jgi:hypothetical protein
MWHDPVSSIVVTLYEEPGKIWKVIISRKKRAVIRA